MDKIIIIEEHLKEKIKDIISLEIIDVSYEHFGHIGFDKSGTHFEITIAFAQQNELTLLQKHKLLNNAVKTLYQTNLIHSITWK